MESLRRILYFLQFWATLVTIITLPTGVTAAGERDPIRCPLKWESFTFGYSPPNGSIDAVPTAEPSGSQDFIIRASTGNEIKIGRLNTEVSEAYIVDSAGKVIFDPEDKQILRNDLGCDLKYIKSGSGTPEEVLLVRSGDPVLKGFVGVALINSEYLSGEVDTGRRVITVVDRQGFRVESNDFFYLTSSSKGFRLEFTKMFFFGEPFSTTIDLMGMDEINNNSPATVSQRLVHTKTTTESMSASHEKQWSVGSDVGMGIDLAGLFSMSFETSFTDSYSVTDSIGTEVTTTMTTEREITVPPLTHVQACTIMGRIDKFYNKPWTALGTYTAKGWTGQEIYDRLVKLDNPPDNMEILKDRVQSTENGALSGEAGVSNVMIILDAQEEDNCLAVEKIIRQIQKLKKQGRKKGLDTTGQVLELQNRLAEIIRIRKPHGANNSSVPKGFKA